MAASSVISLILKGEDQASPVFDAVSGKAGGLGGTMGAVGSKFQTVGKLAGGALLGGVTAAAAGFGVAAKSAVDMNATLETSTLQFETLMGDAEAAEAHVASLFEFAKKTPFETQPIIDASQKLQTFGGDALNTMANLTLVGDAAAATNAPIDELGFWVGRLYSNLQAGQPFGEAAMRLQELAVLSPEARQEMEALQESGAGADEIFTVFQGNLGNFTGAMEKQAGTWKGLTSTIKDALNITMATALKPFFELAKEGLGGLADLLSSDAIASGAQRIADVLANAGDVVGNFFNRMQMGLPIATNMRALVIQLADVFGVSRDKAVALGQGVQSMITWLQDTLGPVVTAVGNFVAWKDVLIVLGAAIASVVIPAIASVVAAVAPVLAVVGAAIAIVAVLRNAWEDNWGGIQEKVQAVLTFLQGLIQSVLGTIQAFWAEHGAAITAKAQAAWTSIQSAVQAAIVFVKNIITTVANGIQAFWQTYHDELLTLASAIWDAIGLYIQGVLENISLVFDAFAALFKGDWQALGQTLQQLWQNTWDTILGILATLWEGVQPLLQSLWESISSWWSGINWAQLGKNITDGIVNGLQAGAGAVMDFIMSIAQQALDSIKDFFGISSPSRVMMTVGAQIAEGLARGIEAGVPAVAKATQNISQAAGIDPSTGGLPRGVKDPRTGKITFPRGSAGTGKPSPAIAGAAAPLPGGNGGRPAQQNITFEGDIIINDETAMRLFLAWLESQGTETALAGLGL